MNKAFWDNYDLTHKADFETLNEVYYCQDYLSRVMNINNAQSGSRESLFSGGQMFTSTKIRPVLKLLKEIKVKRDNKHRRRFEDDREYSEENRHKSINKSHRESSCNRHHRDNRDDEDYGQRNRRRRRYPTSDYSSYKQKDDKYERHRRRDDEYKSDYNKHHSMKRIHFNDDDDEKQSYMGNQKSNLNYYRQLNDAYNNLPNVLFQPNKIPIRVKRNIKDVTSMLLNDLSVLESRQNESLLKLRRVMSQHVKSQLRSQNPIKNSVGYNNPSCSSRRNNSKSMRLPQINTKNNNNGWY